MIGPESPFAVAAVYERVGEGLLVPRIAQRQWMGQYRRIEAFDVVALVDHGPPPGALEVVLELHTERTVVVQALQAAIDIA